MDEFVSRLRAANEHSGPEIFPDEAVDSTTRDQPRRGATLAKKMLLVAAIGLFCYGLGSWTHATAIPENRHTYQSTSEVPVQTVTVTVTVTVTKAVPSLPKECSDALALAAEMEQYTPTIINEGGRATDILKEARLAIMAKDFAKLNALGTRVNQMQNEASGASASLQDLQDRLATKLQECNRVLGR